MPDHDVEQNSEEDSLLGHSTQRAKRFWDGFIDFAMQGNILEIAFGLMSVSPPPSPQRPCPRLVSAAAASSRALPRPGHR